jgi:hypothetical protein
VKRRTQKQQERDFAEYVKELKPLDISELLELSPEYAESLPLYDFKLEDNQTPKTFLTWQEQLTDMAENADPETLEKSALLARRLLESYPIQTNQSEKEKLLRGHLTLLAEYASE